MLELPNGYQMCITYDMLYDMILLHHMICYLKSYDMSLTPRHMICYVKSYDMSSMPRHMICHLKAYDMSFYIQLWVHYLRDIWLNSLPQNSLSESSLLFFFIFILIFLEVFFWLI